MFSNLIESSSHRRELKRRGSFLFMTMAAYALLFIVAGVISIQAVDARLSEQDLELVTIMPLVDLPTPVTDPIVRTPTQPTRSNHNANQQNVHIRQTLVSNTSDPRKVPDQISAEPNKAIPVPTTGIVVLGPKDSDPTGGAGNPTGSGGGGSTVVRNNLVVLPDPPPAVLDQRPVPAVVRRPVLNGYAVSLPKPPYPETARRVRAQGTVSVQVLIDVTGKVVSAQVVSGHPLLSHAARNAAYQARFSPTMIGETPVKVSGVITYNFVMTN
jgi:TonB family protein